MTAQAEGSVSFDQAAAYYDQTRTLPKRLAKAQETAILGELQAIGTDRALEIGIGTGLVSRPLMQRGVRVTGVDIAAKMLGRLRENLSTEHVRPDLLLADATRLPFTDGSFRAIVMSHVFHVVSDVERTLDEIARLLGHGGVFLHDRTRYSESNPWHASYAVREEIMASLGVPVRHRPTPSEIERGLTLRGASLRVERYATSEIDDVAKGMVTQAGSNMFSWAWDVPKEQFDRFLEQYDVWCRETYHEGTYEVAHELEVWTFL
jgi:ubiquinone/menaquinone biosynthesis C-methylase UbiE